MEEDKKVVSVAGKVKGWADVVTQIMVSGQVKKT